MAKLKAISQGSITKPSVQGNFKLLNAQTFSFDSTSFTKDFIDPMKGSPGLVTLKSLPFVTLSNLGDPLNVGGTFNAITAQNITITLDDSFAIHNGVLYKFTKSIDAIIADYDALGKKLLSNTNGLLVFIDPNNLTDTVVIQGDGVTGKELEFTFTVRSTVSNKETNVATFSIVPWENVNIKSNYILTLPSNGADNPIVGFTVTTSTVAEVTTRTATIRLQDNTELVQSWVVETATPITVTDDNANPLRHLIATVGGKQLFETLTSLAQPTIDGTTVSWPYVNENGATQTVSLDLLPLLPTVPPDVFVSSVLWDGTNDNLLNITMSDAVVHAVDFTPYEITTATNGSGQLEVSQKGEIKFTISKVGISNNYNDLDNRPIISGQLPPGRKDQLYFIDQEGTNEVIPDWLMKKGIIVQTQREFEVASTKAVSLEEVFKTWRMFSHYNVDLGGGTSPPNFPALTPDDPQPGTRLTPEEFYGGSLWIYDAVNDRIALTKNVHPYTGFVSPREFGNFTFEATFSSPNSDDDMLALVIGFWIDPITGYEHTLSVIRQLTQSSGQGNFSYRIIKNFDQKTQEIIVDASPLAPYPTGTPGGWSVNSPTRVSVVRTGDVYSIKCSQFGSTVIDNSTEVILDVNTDARLEPFKVATKVAFAAKSQVSAYFSDVVFTGLVDYIFFDQGNYYDTYEYNFSTEEYFLQVPKTVTTESHFGKNRFVESYLFDKIYFINEVDEIICVKGDSVVSWDAFNAITEGSDKRAFLNSALLGGATARDEIKSFNPNYQQNLDFLWKAQWTFGGVLFTLENDPQTSDPADATFSRIDVFALNSDGTGSIIKGTPSADPVKPSIDPLTQLEAGFILIDANATAPNGVTSDKVYNENLQVAGGEFNTAKYPVSTTRWVLDSTVDPSLGTKHINGTNLQLYDAIEFTPSTPIAINQLSSLGYSIKIKAGSYNKHRGPSHRIQLQGTDAGGNPLTIYLPEDTSADIFEWAVYQNLSVLIPQTSAIVNVTKIRFLSWVATSLNFGFYLDNVFLVKGTQSYQLEDYATIKYVNAQDLAHSSRTDNPHSVTKSQVGLGNVDNTSDANKPVSTAQQTAFDLKLDASAYNDRFKGVHLTKSALDSAHPTANAGDSAQVNETGATVVQNYVWDAEAVAWVIGGADGSGAVNTDQLPEGTSNFYHTSARVLSVILSGLSVATGGAIVSTDTILAAFGKLQNQINGKQATLVSATNIKTVNGESLLGAGDLVIAGGGGGGGTFSEERFTWATGNPNTFTVADSSVITDVYINGRRLDKFAQDGVTVDEWRVNNATQIEIMVTITDQDRINVISSSVATGGVSGISTDKGNEVTLGSDSKTYYNDSKISVNSVTAKNAESPLTIPTYDGSGQSTHPSVVDLGSNPISGYRYWMAFTPYPNEDSTKENPSIVASNDKTTWVVPAGLTNPIEPVPVDGTYLADTELVLGYDNKFYCYFRAFSGTTAFTKVKSSTDGITWSATVTACTETTGQGLVSPTIFKENSGYTMYEIDAEGTVHKIYRRFSLNPLDFSASVRTLCTYEGIPDGFTPWHIFVKLVNGVKYVILNTIDSNQTGAPGGELIFGSVKDDHFTFNKDAVLSPLNSWELRRLYRASLLVNNITDKGIEWDVFYGGVSNANVWKIGYTTMKSVYNSVPVKFIGNKKTNFTLSVSENGKTLTNLAYSSQVVTVPLNATVPLNVGYHIEQIISYPNVTTYSPVSGVTILTEYGKIPTSNPNGGKVYLEKIAEDTWFLSGDLEAGTQTTSFPTSGLVSEWKLDETSGAVLDSFGTHNGTNTGATQGAAGKIGTAYSFNGSTNKVSFPNHADFNMVSGGVDMAFTVRVLVKFNITTGNHTIITKGGNAQREWIVLYESGKMIFRLTGQGNSLNNIVIQHSFTITSGIWYDFVFGYDGSGTMEGLVMYKDAVSVGTKSTAGTYTNMLADTFPLELGKYEGITTYSLNGSLDNINIWKGVLLSQEDVLFMNNNGNPIGR